MIFYDQAYNGMSWVGQIFIGNVYQISYKGVNLFVGHPVSCIITFILDA